MEVMGELHEFALSVGDDGNIVVVCKADGCPYMSGGTELHLNDLLKDQFNHALGVAQDKVRVAFEKFGEAARQVQREQQGRQGKQRRKK